MSIAVEDWDELAVAGRPHGERERRAATGELAVAGRQHDEREESAATIAVEDWDELAVADRPHDEPEESAAAIAVEDWDELAVARRRRGEREESAATESKSNAATEDESEGPTLGYYKHKDDSYGEVLENFRVPAAIAAGNAVFWLTGRLFGVVELIGVASLISVALLLAAYVLREWQRDRTALICLAGALPLPLTIFGLFS